MYFYNQLLVPVTAILLKVKICNVLLKHNRFGNILYLKFEDRTIRVKVLSYLQISQPKFPSLSPFILKQVVSLLLSVTIINGGPDVALLFGVKSTLITPGSTYRKQKGPTRASSFLFDWHIENVDLITTMY